MKRIFILTTIILSFILNIKAQEFTRLEVLPILYINKDITLHFRSPEKVNYIDISTKKLIGDIPVDNLAKIKCILDEDLSEDEDLGVVSIVGNSYLVQYRIRYRHNCEVTEVEISQERMKSLQYPSITMTEYELKRMCLDIQKKPRKLKKTQSKAMGLSAYLNNIYAYGDYIFIDLTFLNHTNLKYDIDDINYKIEDKKIYKATNSQSVEIKPIYSLYNNEYFVNSYRNVLVFPKFTFPNDKIFKVRVFEKQISGRTLELIIEYRDLLNADTI